MNIFLHASASLAIVLGLYLASSSGSTALSRRLLAAAFLSIAVLNLLTLLQFDAPGHPVLLLRPVLAAALPVLLYLHVTVAIRANQSLQLGDIFHVTGPCIAIVLRLLPNLGGYLDGLIVLLNVFYLALIAWDSRQGTTNIDRLGGQLSLLLDRWRRLVMLFLITVTLIDLVIIFTMGDDVASSRSPWVFGLAGLLLALGFSYLLVTGMNRKGPLAWVSSRFRTYEPESDRLIERLESELLSSGMYLDPNLTLQRFARRVGLPMREVSVAINDSRNRNYNQWINTFRIREAELILRNEPNRSVTDVMLATGFQNKSTFNAAFRAINGRSPTEWRDSQNHATGSEFLG
jgi:AraC-like DNA-binding protein